MITEFPFPVYSYGDDSRLEPSDLELIDNIDWICSFYEAGDYEGNGIAFMRRGDKFYKKYLGHCSCFGPWSKNESFNETMDIDSWDEVYPEDIIQFALVDVTSAIQVGSAEFGSKLLFLMEHTQ